MKKLIPLFAAVALLASCAHPGQNRYGYQDVGKKSTVSFGTVISLREVEITGKNTGAGALIGAGAGAGAGSYVGHGSGSVWAAAGTMIAGAIIGGMAEQAMSDRQGLEYVITLENGETLTIVQNINPDDKPIREGDRVMVQGSGTYQRVLLADKLPEKIKRPKKIKVVD
jgi:outer membrane lipoprotein SlyB